MSLYLADLVAPACVALRRLADDAEAAPAARHAHVGETIAESRREAVGALERLAPALAQLGHADAADVALRRASALAHGLGVSPYRQRAAADGMERWAEEQAKALWAEGLP